MTSYERYIRECVLSREEIDVFLDPDEATWAQFDPEVGYVLGNFMPRDGLDGSSTISTVQRNGARTGVIYANRPCRINTYGNSFTQCHQVSDEETWQEYLAAHLGEPVRNFGMGGFGVYQAYRRMIRTEAGPEGAEYVILYVWGDDHIRSLLRCRHILTRPWWGRAGGRLLHGNFWAHVEMDLESGRLVEKECLLSTPESLYKMTDPDFLWDALKDDLMQHICLFCQEAFPEAELDLARLQALARILGVAPVNTGTPELLRQSVSALRDAFGFAATRFILEKAANFARRHGKKLMIALLCPRATRELLTTDKRYDQEIVDFLKAKGFRCFDMNCVHQEDFKCFKLSLDEYLGRYYIGHYSPAGNHFFAYSIKKHIVEWLDPKPITYSNENEKMIGFKGYLAE